MRAMIKPESNIMEMLRDPDEGPFLRELIGISPRAAHPPYLPRRLIGFLCGLLGRPVEDSLLMSYARYLEKRDRDRAEFLRLEALLSGRGQGGGIPAERQARYQELLHALAPFDRWLQAVRRNYRILNCGRAPELAYAIRFRFRCPTSWEALAATPDPGVRHCAMSPGSLLLRRHPLGGGACLRGRLYHDPHPPHRHP